MERYQPGYYPDPYLQYPRSAGQVYTTPGTANAVTRTSPAGTTMEYIRTGQGAGEGHRRVDYYVQEHPAATGAKPLVGEYYIPSPTVPGGIRPAPAAAYYSQEPQISGGTRPAGEYYIQVVPPPGGNKAPAAGASVPAPVISGGSRSCGCAPKVEYSYIQAPIAAVSAPLPAHASTRQGLQPATIHPSTGYYYAAQESAPSRGAAIPTAGETYPPYGPYPGSSGQNIVAYERYVVPASSTFTYDPTSAFHDYYRPSQPPGAPQSTGYRYDGDGYPGHVTGSLQPIQNDFAERFGAMRIGGGRGGANDVTYVPRTSNNVVHKNSEIWRPMENVLSAGDCKKCARK